MKISGNGRVEKRQKTLESFLFSKKWHFPLHSFKVLNMQYRMKN